MKFLRKGFALFAGLMLLSNVFLPSAVVFAEEGTPLAATEQVNQVAQSEATASVEENSTPEVSPEKVVSESSEALAPETPKAEEGSETPAEKVNQEAKEEQKAEPVSDLATSSEPKKAEPASESEEGRGETLTPAQQGAGDAGSSDSVVAAPEDKQSIEEKNSKMVSQPSIELREVTAKSDWASKRTVSFYGYDVEVDENNKVTITPEMENLLKKLDSDVQEVLAAELLSIESENVLFVHTKKGKNKPTKVFPENANSTLKGKFKGKVTKHIVTLKAQWDEATIVAPSWVDTTKLSNKERAGFHTVTINGKEAFTVKTDDFGWFYVAKKIEKPSQPTQPTIKTETFYTSNDKDFPVAMKDEKVVDIEESKKLLQKALPGITKEEDKKLVEEFIAKATDDVEIKTIHNQRLLFVKVNDHTTKVFRDSRDPLFKNAFKHTKAIVGEPVNVDLENSISPKWISDREKYEITHFVKIEDKGYTLLTVSGHWFYAPVKFNIVNFYGSNNKPFKVVMQDQNTVDLERTKELLVPEIPRLPVDLQEEAEDFAKNWTDADVVIKEVEEVKLLFVKTSKHTKVFRNSPTDTMFQNAFREGSGMHAAIIYTDPIVKPDWVNTDSIIKYNEVKKDGKLIGYALKNKENHWFYAPKKSFKTTNFFGSAWIAIPVVLEAEKTLDLNATKAVLWELRDRVSPDKQKAFEELGKKIKPEDVEIHNVGDQRLLFVKWNDHTTKVFYDKGDSPFKGKFGSTSSTKGTLPADADLSKKTAPKWISDHNDVTHYNKVGSGYALLTKVGHWFYAPAKVVTPSTGGSSSGGGGWGGGTSSSSSSTSKPSTTPSTGEYTELVLSGEVTTPICSIANSIFAEEQNQAYLWACERDITTIRAIENARLNDPLTRAELAKMMSMYATKVLGKQIVITGEVKYADVDSSLGDLADYIKLAYQLQIMGIHADGTALTNFAPHALVSRAEFGTVLSRVLFGAQYNQDGAERYAKHLNALKEVKVLTNTTPTLQELRGWVMLMMMRTEKMLETIKK